MPPKYEVGFTRQLPERRSHYIQHHEINAGETHEPRYPITVLIDEFIGQLDMQERETIKTDSYMMANAIGQLVDMAHQSFEYTEIWEARERKDFKRADELMVDLQSMIRIRLTHADSANLMMSDTDLTDAQMDDFLKSFDQFDQFEQEAYDKQERQMKKFAEGPSEDTLKGERDGELMFKEWLESPASVDQNMADMRTHYNGGDSKFTEDYVVAAERTYRRLKNDYAHQMSIQETEKKRAEIEQEKKGVRRTGASETTKEETTRTTESSQATQSSSKKEEKRVAGFGSRQTYTSTTSTTSTTTKADAGFVNYDELPDGDQLEDLYGDEPLEALGDGVYRAQEFVEPTHQPRSRLERMRRTRAENPKLGKNYAEGMKKGIMVGRGMTLPDSDDTVETRRVNFKRKPFLWMKTRANEFYRRHRKPLNVMAKMTAIVTVQLGINTMAGRFEFKEDRHFVQMIFLTMTSFYLTQSLKKEGMDVNQAAFVM